VTSDDEGAGRDHDIRGRIHHRAARRSGEGARRGWRAPSPLGVGGPWTYDSGPKGEPAGEDAEWLAETTSRVGAVVGGRWTYEAAGHWGGENPWGLPFFIVTHRTQDEPEGGGFTFVSGVDEAVQRARDAAGDRDVHVMGGGDVIRQALEAGLVDELTVIIAPITLGGGKRLFDGFSRSLDLEHLGVRQSPFATFIDYRVKG
jgi:dihydrofolate reductase